MGTKNRYKIIEGSETNHCCFEYMIVDTHEPDDDNGHSKIICELLDEDTATFVCETLNCTENR